MKDAYTMQKATNPTSMGFLQRAPNPTNKKRGKRDGVADPYQASMNYFNYFKGLRDATG